MKEYIEREALLQALEEIGGCGAPPESWADGWDKAISQAIEFTKQQLSAGVTEVRHGKWLDSNGDYTDAVCSVCSELYDAISPPDRASKEWFELFCDEYKYCPNCGAKMDGKRKDMKKILDACCGSRMFWFDKENPDVEFVDIREFDNEMIWKSGNGKAVRYCNVHPTTVADFTDLPFPDNTFYHVVFDPPHLTKIGENSWMCKKYGKLYDGWEFMLHKGFLECMRVLKPNGTLVFKWSEVDIPVKKILQVIGMQPLYGHKSGKQAHTHWMCFMK